MSHPDYRLVNGKIPYGTEYWFTRATTRDQMRNDFSQIREAGLNTIRIFIPPCENSPNQYDYQTVDDLFGVALEHGLSICPTFTLDISTWRKQTIGLNPSLGVPSAYLLDDPAYKKELAPGLQSIVQRYGKHAALWSWILWNEPSRSPFFPPPPPVWKAFQKWLEEKYENSLERFLESWFPLQRASTIQKFTDIQPGYLHSDWAQLWDGFETGAGYNALVPPIILRTTGRVQPRSWDAFPHWQDWLNFNSSALTESICWLSALVQDIDPIHPTQINPDGFIQNQSAVSRNLIDLSDSVDLFGSSLHLGHHFGHIQIEHQIPEAIAFYSASIQSAARGKHALVTELQGGPNTWSGNFQFTPDANDLILWSLTAFGYGLKGIIYWLWKPRLTGWEAGEWGLINLNGRNTPRTLGIARLGRFIEEHSTWLAKLTPQKSAVAILRSPESETLGLIESLYSTQPVDQFQPISEYGCFRALWRAGIAADLISPQELQTGKLTRYRCLFIPFSEAMTAETAREIIKFVHAGGWVYAETPCATKNPHGTASVTQPGFGLAEIFAQSIDIWPARKEPIIETPFGPLHSDLFIQPLESSDHEVVGELTDGYDVIVERSIGKGRTLYAGTCLTLSCGRNSSSLNEEAYLASFALRSGARPTHKSDIPFSSAVYFLESADGDALIILNHAQEENELEVSLPHTYRSASALLGRSVPQISRRKLHILMPPRSGEVLRLER